MRDGLPIYDRRQQADEADQRHLANPPRPYPPRIGAHQQRERHRGGHGEHAPRAFRQRFYDDQRQHGQDDHHDHEGAEQRDCPCGLPHFHADQFAQRLAVAAHGNEQDHEILHSACQHHARDDPDSAGQIPHLRGEDRPHQRPGARDRCKMMAEQDHAVGCDIIKPVRSP